MPALANRERYRKIANRARRIPGEHGLRPWRVYIYTGTWSDQSANEFGDGSRTDTATEILENGQPPKVREIGDEAIALSADLTKGDMAIGPITPVVGTPWATLLATSKTAGDTVRIKLVHDETGATLHCSFQSSQQDRALRYMLTVRPIRSDD
jgi:hypothetical protein